jgi:ribosomal protein L12E/L44/L45/RPP1/RPP2
MEIENSMNSKMENIFYAALALHVAGKPLNNENIRLVLRAAGTPVDEPSLDLIGAFIESLKNSQVNNDSSNNSNILNLLTTAMSRKNSPGKYLEKIDAEKQPTLIARYVYGIVTGGKEIRLGPVGIENSEVYTITYQDLRAIVHSCPAKPYQSLDDEMVKKWVKAHQNVLDISREHFNVIIPLSFDTILKPGDDGICADQVVRNWLMKDSVLFHSVISQISGKDEYAVQVSYTPSTLSKNMPEPGPEILKIKNEITQKSPGVAYIYKQKLEKLIKVDMQKLADSWFHDFYRRINQHANKIVVEQTRKLENDRVMLCNFSCLVSKDKVEGLGEELEKINNIEGFSVHFSGPWPPYSFVGKPLMVAVKEGPNGTN